MHKLEISVPVALDQSFTYQSEFDIPAGCRVIVPFGERNRKVVAVVLGPSPAQSNELGLKLKSVIERLDDEPVFSESMLNLAKWMSQYYIHPLGEVLKSMLPASMAKRVSQKIELTAAGIEAKEDAAHLYHALLKAVWKRSDALEEKTVKSRLKVFFASTGGKSVTIGRLVKVGLLVRSTDNVYRVREWKSEGSDNSESQLGECPKNLTALQGEVLAEILNAGLLAKSKGVIPCLLHGITGSGKTEIYLQAIEQLLKSQVNAQVLVLVPEISLTPQMTRVFSARFPGQVAVVHSAMTPKDRWKQLSLIRTGSRCILIGPRSAVFAAFANLRFVIVDEEHDTSYKQGSGLSYHGRDVAVMRCFIESVFILLGSATPSMETFYNAKTGKYRYLALNERPLGQGLPQIDLVQPSISFQYAKRLGKLSLEPRFIDLPVDKFIVEQLQQNYTNGLQSMVIVNRRGYAYYLFSLREKKAVTCKNCSVSLTVHKRSTLLKCHYCGVSCSIQDVIGAANPDDYALVGYGSEQMEVFLKEAISGAKISRVDSDVVGQKNQLNEILKDFQSGAIDILVGTQMLAKGHDFAKVSLICILELDQSLNLPDFRSGERTFQLMVQAAGRAGRGEYPGRVIIQTLKPDHPILQAGLKQDYMAFWENQLPFRRACCYPPFSRMILFEFSGSNSANLQEFMKKVDLWIHQTLKSFGKEFGALQVLGPSIPPMEIVRGRHRRSLLLASDQRAVLWSFASQLRAAFRECSGDISVRVDVDPQNMM